MSRGGADGVSGLCVEAGGGESMFSSSVMLLWHIGQVLLFWKDKIIKIM